MKKLIVIVAVLATWLNTTAITTAQSYQTNGGLIVTDESLLSSSHKRLVFVVTKNIPGPVRIELQTVSSEGIVNQFTPLQFPQGLQLGQIIPVWDGNLNSFHNTPWLNFWVTIVTPTHNYYSNTMMPIGYRELYKEPMIISISETGGYEIPYQITVKGIFDTTIPSLILINSSVFVSAKAVTQTAPGTIQFTMPSGNFEQFPSGKYLLTICQASHCDTLTGRHR